jgi:hypothetical protein
LNIDEKSMIRLDMLFRAERCCRVHFTTVLSYPKGLLRDIDEFRAERRGDFGSVFAASGFRTTEDGNSSKIWIGP